MRPRKCTAISKDGTPCRGWATRKSDPPRCSPHGGGRAPTGAPKGNTNALKHGFQSQKPESLPKPDEPGPDLDTIDDIYDDLARKQSRLSAYIDKHLKEMDAFVVARLLTLHAQTATRLANILRDRAALDGPDAGGITDAIAQALDELSEELGVDL